MFGDDLVAQLNKEFPDLWDAEEGSIQQGLRVVCKECGHFGDARRGPYGEYMPLVHSLGDLEQTTCPGSNIARGHRMVALVDQYELRKASDRLARGIASIYYATRWGVDENGDFEHDPENGGTLVYEGYVDPDTEERVVVDSYRLHEREKKYREQGLWGNEGFDRNLARVERIARARISAKRLGQLPLYSDLLQVAKSVVDADRLTEVFGDSRLVEKQDAFDRLVRTLGDLRACVEDGAPAYARLDLD